MIIGVLYGVVAIEQIFFLGNIGIGFAYICYALSNGGLFISTPQGAEWFTNLLKRWV